MENLLLPVSSLLAVALVGWLTYSLYHSKQQIRSLRKKLIHQEYELRTVENHHERKQQTILEDTGCESVTELVHMYSLVLRVLPSNLARFYEPRESRLHYQYSPSPDIQRQVAAVGRVLRAMQEPKSRYRPVLERVEIDKLYHAFELKEEFSDLLPLLEGLTFEQMVGLSLAIINHGGISISEALKQNYVKVAQITP